MIAPICPSSPHGWRLTLATALAAGILTGCASGGGSAAAPAVDPPPVATPAVPPLAVPAAQPWTHPEVSQAWSQGYQGQGATITVFDDFDTTSPGFDTSITGQTLNGTHGLHVQNTAALVAPLATMRPIHDMTAGAATLVPGFNVFNLSYGIVASPDIIAVPWDPLERSVIDIGQAGSGVVVKSAGNDAIPVLGINGFNEFNYLARDLAGGPSVIFAGALEGNGSVSAPASLASYSNFPGSNTTVQNQFLLVGIDSVTMGTEGTSFAAPIVSGYAAIVHSKFPAATPTQVVNQLLDTARQDTILNFNPTLHGRGEASLQRALAPASLQ